MTAAVPFPFFVGVGRSGTTLLRSIFNAHSELAVAHESRFVAEVARHPDRYDRAGSFDVDRFVDDVLEDRKISRIPEWGIDVEVFRHAVQRSGADNPAVAVRLIYRAYADVNGKPRYGDKTPGYVRFLTSIGDLLPEARFVHLVRDGRDVALSSNDVDFGAANLVQAAHRWAERTRRAQDMGRHLGPARYLLLRYEDLIDEPEREVQKACDFLEFTYEPAMLRYFEDVDRVFGGLAGQEHHERLRLPVTKGLRDWRRQMPPDDVRRFEVVAGDMLSELGYELTAPVDARTTAERTVTALRVLQGRAVAAYRARRRAGDKRS
ncbi:MAG TPA: sulfotransferase [Acidimicrobiales bacterium]|nr:sulfotransferase [Acidimicrobiales bacterium]